MYILVLKNKPVLVASEDFISFYLLCSKYYEKHFFEMRNDERYKKEIIDHWMKNCIFKLPLNKLPTD